MAESRTASTSTPFSITAGRIVPPSDGGRGSEWRTRWTMLRLFSWRHGYLTRRGRKRAYNTRWGIDTTSGGVGVLVARDDEDGPEMQVRLWPLWVDLWVVEWPRPDATNGSQEQP